MINLLLSNFYPVMSYRRGRKESDELLCTVWSLVMVRELVASARGLTKLSPRYFCKISSRQRTGESRRSECLSVSNLHKRYKFQTDTSNVGKKNFLYHLMVFLVDSMSLLSTTPIE